MIAKLPSKRSASRQCLLRFGTSHAATTSSREFHTTSQGTSRPERATKTAIKAEAPHQQELGNMNSRPSEMMQHASQPTSSHRLCLPGSGAKKLLDRAFNTAMTTMYTRE